MLKFVHVRLCWWTWVVICGNAVSRSEAESILPVFAFFSPSEAKFLEVCPATATHLGRVLRSDAPQPSDP